MRTFKTLVTYKLGESFAKQQNREGVYYGQLYARRKAAYMVANDEGRFAGAAAQILLQNYSKDTDAYAALSKEQAAIKRNYARWRDGLRSRCSGALPSFY